MKTFIDAQFGYCPLVWMFYGRVSNRKVNHLHERLIGNLYRDSIGSFHVKSKSGYRAIWNKRKSFKWKNE